MFKRYPQTESLGFVITVFVICNLYVICNTVRLHSLSVLDTFSSFNKFIHLKPECLLAKNCSHIFSFWLDNQANRDRQIILQIKIKENWEGGG